MNTLYEVVLCSKNFSKTIAVYQKQNLKQGIGAIKSPSTTKNFKMRSKYQMCSGKLKLEKKNQLECGKFYDNTNHTMLTQNGAYSA